MAKRTKKADIKLDLFEPRASAPMLASEPAKPRGKRGKKAAEATPAEATPAEAQKKPSKRRRIVRLEYSDARELCLELAFQCGLTPTEIAELQAQESGIDRVVFRKLVNFINDVADKVEGITPEMKI